MTAQERWPWIDEAIKFWVDIDPKRRAGLDIRAELLSPDDVDPTKRLELVVIARGVEGAPQARSYLAPAFVSAAKSDAIRIALNDCEANLARLIREGRPAPT